MPIENLLPDNKVHEEIYPYETYSQKFAPTLAELFYLYYLGQKVTDKLTKLSKIGFSVECFTVDFLLFFTKKRQILAFGWTAAYSPSNPSISGIF